MVGYVTLGTNDLQRAAKFYDGITKELGVGRMMENEKFIGWGMPGGGAGIGITKPFDGKPATVGNGTMIAFSLDSRAEVDAFYAKAIALGGSDEGAPGERAPGVYFGYFRDLDGNKFCVFQFG